MAGTRQILFIQGGGAGAHDEWDDKLFDSLSRELRAGTRSATRACPTRTTRATPGGARPSGVR